MVQLFLKIAVDAKFTFGNSIWYRYAFSCLPSGLKVVSSGLSSLLDIISHLMDDVSNTENVTFFKTVYNLQQADKFKSEVASNKCKKKYL